MITLALTLFVQAAAPPDTLTLASALQRAFSMRPQVAAAAATMDRARGTLRVAGLVPNPTLDMQFDRDAPTRKSQFIQPLGWLARRGPDRAAARALVIRDAADSTQQMAFLARDVRVGYYAAIAAGARALLVREQADLADSLAAIAERRMQAGDISALERDQAVQEAARLALLRSRAREEAATTRITLERALGATDPLVLPVDLPAWQPNAMDGAAAAAPRRAIAEAEAVAAGERSRSAARAQLPIPSVLAGVEWDGTPSQGTNVILGFTVPLPLWQQGGSIRAQARADAAVAAAAAGEAALDVDAQIAAARVRAREAGARAEIARTALAPAARQLRAGTLRLYEAGRVGLLPVLDALRAERDVAQTVLSEGLAARVAEADLLAILGRIQ